MPTYLAGKNSKLILDAVFLKVEAGTLNLTIATDEVTNNFSGGYYEDVATIKRATITGMRCVYDGDDPPNFEDGDLKSMELYIPNGPRLTGTFRVGSLSVPLVDVRAAVHFGFDLSSQGIYVWTWKYVAP
jgi:hypothetical protein